MIRPALRAADVIRLLELRPHPEGGHFRETFRDKRAASDGRAASTAPCARRSFDTATICMALVIFCVDLTDAIRFLSSFSDGIAQRLRARFKTADRLGRCRPILGKGPGVGFDRRLELGFNVIRQIV